MQYSTNFNMNKPERADQYNLDHWNENTDILDTTLQNEINNRIANVNTERTRASNAEIALRNLTDSTLKESIFNYIYPIGSIYRNASNSNNPHDIFGFGTWEAITDKFLACKGSTFVTSGGATSYTLSWANIPEHSHLMNHYHWVDINHNHTINDPGHNHQGDYGEAGNGDHRGFAHIVLTSSGGGETWNRTTGITVNYTGELFKATNYALAEGASPMPYTGTYGSSNPTAISIIPPYQAVYTWKRTA